MPTILETESLWNWLGSRSHWKNQDRGLCRLAPQTAIKSGDRHIFWRQPNNLATARISGDKFWRRQNLICVEFIIYVGIGIINSTHEEVFHVKFHKKFWRQVLASPDFWRRPDFLAVWGYIPAQIPRNLASSRLAIPVLFPKLN